MEHHANNIQDYIKPGRTVHLVGIGGISMQSLGPVFRGMGLKVTGSDKTSSATTDKLIAQGIKIYFGHYPENVRGADFVVRTAAVHDDNPEIMAARAAGIPVFERAQAWGMIMKAYKNAICISGTHGKTSTTAMVTHILMAAQWDPTVMIGGFLPLIHDAYRVGKGDTIVLESCEYCDSFLSFFPTLAVVLNIEEDHVDYFENLKAIERSFHKFADAATKGVLANGDDANTLEALEGLRYVTFGLGEHNRVRGVNVSEDWQHLDVTCDGEFYCHLDLKVLGRHNALNAIAAAGTAWMLGIPGEAVTRGLESFLGASRRLEYKGSFNGADIYDDFAHHPSEMAVTLDVIAKLGYKRVVVCFQPYTYTRTKTMLHQFAEQLKRVDLAIVSEIMAARETDTLGISSHDLTALVPGSIYVETLADMTAKIKELARPGDMFVTMGCGNVNLAAEALFK